MIFLKQVLTILWKDIRCELRSKQTWMGMGLFALLVLVIFNFAFDLRVDNKAARARLSSSLAGTRRAVADRHDDLYLDDLPVCADRCH